MFESQDIKIWVHPEDLSYLQGTQLELEQQGLNQVLKFHNPNVKNTCGCGESFSVD
jgi:iron-sulfur cluster assembly protein